ncbi:MAG: CinA family nicotinamide mononucleotide deamidase-related protein [Paramuribaculum sp.]
MRITVICIGDELLIGQVTDTNSGFLARTIAPEGWEVERTEVVADDAEAITDAIERALSRTDVVITTGGLGPTADDITKPTLCKIFGGGLRHDPAVEANVREVMSRRGREMNELTRLQSMVPESATIIQNRVGTAPILMFERDGKTLVAMPGVPFETQEMFVAEVFPRLLSRYSSGISVAHSTMIVAGISESMLAEHLAEFENSLPKSLHLAYLPKPGIIRLRLDGHSTDANALNAFMADYVERLREATAQWRIADDDLPTAAILIERLRERGLTMATAESCTGGNIAHEITLIAGASDVMAGGVVAYSNSVKSGLLGVDPDLIAAYGAVSIPVAEAMASGACLATGADIAIATSGIAGPGGGTPDKPVGTVCVAVASPSGLISTTLHLHGTRQRIIERATSEALLMAISAL